MGKHYGKVIIEEVLRMKAQGMTHRAIGEEYGLTMIQIKKLVERDRKSKRMLPKPSRPKGRPRKRPLTVEENYNQEIKRLKMEVELLRSFLQAAGRR
jgi:transposase